MPQTAVIELQTHAAEELVDITEEVASSLAGLGVSDGICWVSSPHTTAGITVNEHADPDVRRDMLHALDRTVARHDPAYRHAEGNSAAHLKASLMGLSAMVPVREGRLTLGTWQGIFFCEFDGPRRRRLLITVLS